MARWTHFFLVRIEFLGFRYHGWQKQEPFKTVQGMVDKTLLFILGHENFKTLGCGRTDAKVSADDFAFELFMQDHMDTEEVLKKLNQSLPSDIRAKSVEVASPHFNIIQHPKIKEYHYLFCFGEKSHPFNAPFLQNFGEQLNIELMMLAAKEFVGKHNFKRYASKPTAQTVFEREILFSEIVPNRKLGADFFPAESYLFKVSSRGFLRYQVRLMMGALIDVGKALWTLDDLKESLTNYNGKQIRHIAPSSALTLHKVIF